MYSRLRTSKMERIKLSILILTHNRPEMFHEALATVNDGFIKDLEVVVLNNGNDFNLKKKSKIKYHHKPGLGLTDSYKYLIDQAKGEYAVFLEDDDKLILNVLWEKMMMYDYDLYLFNYFVNNETNHKFYPKQIWKDKEYKSLDFLMEMHDLDPEADFHLGQVMFRTKLAKSIVFPNTDIIGMDEYFLYKMITLSGSILTSSQPGYMARVHGDNLSWDNPDNVLESDKAPIHLIYPEIQKFAGKELAFKWSERLSEIYDKKLSSAREKLLTPTRITTTRK